METADIVTEIKRKIEEPDYDTDTIVSFINSGVLEIAGGGEREHGNALLPPLPDLYSNDTVTLLADTSSVSMPATYHRSLKMVFDSSGYPLKRYNSHAEFIRKYSGETGDPEAFCLVGSTLWLGPSPSSNAVITVYFYRLPVDLVDDDDDIDGLPEHLKKRLVVHYVCKEIFSEIEQGMDGVIPDTAKHNSMYQRALTDLERYIGPEDKEAINVGDNDYGDEYNNGVY